MPIIKWGHETKLVPVDWLWKPMIPYGKVTIVEGDGGEGDGGLAVIIGFRGRDDGFRDFAEVLVGGQEIELVGAAQAALYFAVMCPVQARKPAQYLLG